MNHEDSFYSCGGHEVLRYGHGHEHDMDLGICDFVGWCMKLYDSKEICEKQPNEYVLRIGLEKGHYASPICRLGSVKISAAEEAIYAFYLMKDYGVMVPLKQIKLCCSHKETAERLARVIDANSN